MGKAKSRINGALVDIVPGTVQDGDIDSETATAGKVLTADGSGNATWESALGGNIEVGEIDSEASTAGQVIASDGAGGAAWSSDPVLDTVTANAIAAGDASLGINGKAGSAGVGGSVVVAGGIGDGAVDGGVVSLAGGTSGAGATGNGGKVDIDGGAAGSTNGDGGMVDVDGGTGTGTGAGGAISLMGGYSGSGATANGGAVSLLGGLSLATDGDGGDVTITAGEAAGTGTGGDVDILSGASAGATGTAGSVAIDAGPATGGTAGTIEVGVTNASGVSVGKSGGALTLRGTSMTVHEDELNKLDGAPLGAPTFTVGSDTGTEINVAIQLKDGHGDDLAVRGSVFAYLSDDANGDSIAAVPPSGGLAIGTDGLMIPIGATSPAFLLVSESDGDIDIDITEAGGATWYLVIVLPNGLLAVSGAITFAP